MQVYKYANMQVCKYAVRQVCSYAGIQVCRYAGIQVCRYSERSLKVLTGGREEINGLTLKRKIPGQNNLEGFDGYRNRDYRKHRLLSTKRLITTEGGLAKTAKDY